MPRPKRSKVTPSVPVHHVPRTAPISSPAQKKNGFSSQSSGRVTSGSDNSDGLVISKTRNTGKNAPMAQLYTMSGALAPEDIGSTHPRPPSARARATLSTIVKETDLAKAEGEKRARKVSRATSIEEPNEVPSSIPTRAAESRRPSSSRLGLSSAQQNIQLGLEVRIYETPRVHSSSMLGGATFKKRLRQPSLLRMAESQKNISEELDDNDMYDFMPDDESTPIIKALSHKDAPSSSSSHQAPGSRKRKMKSPEIQVPASQSIDINSSPSAVPSPSDHHEESSEDNQTPPVLPPPRAAETPPPEIFSDTLAPPHSSSSPLPEPEPQNARKKPVKAASKAKSRSTKPAHKKFSTAPSPLSSTSTQISPVRPAALKPLSTATLQNLLPRRRVRRKPKGAYDIPSSSDVELDNVALGEDEDELSFNATTKMRKKKTQSMVPPSVKAKAKETVTGTKGKRISNTYTRKSIMVSHDDENVSESENENEARYVGRYGSRARSSTPALDSKAKEEMRRLAEKFREVDEYTLDFEDMTASSDKMKDAR